MNEKNGTRYQHVESRLIKRLRIYIIIVLIMLSVIAFEVVTGAFSVILALIGIISGLLIGTIISRIYKLSWDEETHNVIGRVDKIGSLILVLYFIFIFTRAYYIGYWIQGAPLFAFILSLTAGTLLGRVLSTRRGIIKVLNAAKFYKKL